MKQIHRAFFFILVIAMCFLLVSCKSEETEELIQNIDLLEELPFDGDSFVKDFNENIVIMQSTQEKLDAIATAYSALDDKQKEYVTNYSKYESLKNQYDSVISETAEDIYIVAILVGYKNRELMKTTLDVYGDAMSHKNRQELFGQYAFYEEAPSYLDDYIRNRLKSPSSYRRYNLELSKAVTYFEEKDEFTARFSIKYGGTNSFGAEITKAASGLLHFVADVDEGTIKFTDIFML